MKKKNVYKVLKHTALIILPAVATLIGGLGKIWDWKFTSHIVLTITTIDTFLGTVLGLTNYKEE